MHTGSPQGLWAMLELRGSYSWVYVELYRLVHAGVGLLLAQKLGVWVSIEVSLQFWVTLGPCWGYVRPVGNKLLGVYEVILVQVGLLLIQKGSSLELSFKILEEPTTPSCPPMRIILG